jgi:DNA-binding NtrC family response regulator
VDTRHLHPIYRDVSRDIDCAIESDVNVLISGSDVRTSVSLAHMIHERGARRRGPFVVVDSRQLREAPLSEFKARICSAASTGSVFIDEVATMTWAMQTELMRLLEPDADGPLDDLDCRGLRIIAATTSYLLDAVRANTFRADLFYRLNYVHVAMFPATDGRQPWLM